MGLKTWLHQWRLGLGNGSELIFIIPQSMSWDNLNIKNWPLNKVILILELFLLFYVSDTGYKYSPLFIVKVISRKHNTISFDFILIVETISRDYLRLWGRTQVIHLYLSFKCLTIVPGLGIFHLLPKCERLSFTKKYRSWLHVQEAMISL